MAFGFLWYGLRAVSSFWCTPRNPQRRFYTLVNSPPADTLGLSGALWIFVIYYLRGTWNSGQTKVGASGNTRIKYGWMRWRAIVMRIWIGKEHERRVSSRTSDQLGMLECEFQEMLIHWAQWLNSKTSDKPKTLKRVSNTPIYQRHASPVMED